mmetsp:Transcript_17865/g.71624  ORF Transcript_17865/g.71624 Transcript_17865/m.71624 type:complete len:290 (+) Transcript_17865:1549-2418(+)
MRFASAKMGISNSTVATTVSPHNEYEPSRTSMMYTNSSRSTRPMPAPMTTSSTTNKPIASACRRLLLAVARGFPSRSASSSLPPPRSVTEALASSSSSRRPFDAPVVPPSSVSTEATRDDSSSCGCCCCCSGMRTARMATVTKVQPTKNKMLKVKSPVASATRPMTKLASPHEMVVYRRISPNRAFSASPRALIAYASRTPLLEKTADAAETAQITSNRPLEPSWSTATSGTASSTSVSALHACVTSAVRFFARSRSATRPQHGIASPRISGIVPVMRPIWPGDSATLA